VSEHDLDVVADQADRPDVVRELLRRERRDARAARREANRLRERVAELERHLAELKTEAPEALALVVARAHGLPEEAVRWLQGSSLDGLEESAAELRASVGYARRKEDTA
jgi:hypothetical protein